MKLIKDSDKFITSMMKTRKQDKIKGALLGLFAGDALGAQVEFMSKNAIARKYPDGVREMAGSPVWGTLPGQLTDDSELAISLARALIEAEGYLTKDRTMKHYLHWYKSGPFDCGNTIREAILTGKPNQQSQANGAMMRAAPIPLFFHEPREELTMFLTAAIDAEHTHPNMVCMLANMLFCGLIHHAINADISARGLFDYVPECIEKIKKISGRWTAEEKKILSELYAMWENARDSDFNLAELVDAGRAGWVLLALSNLLHQLKSYKTMKNAIIDTVGIGGDTDTNAAICGAVFGAIEGTAGTPEDWTEAIKNCYPTESNARHPRPSIFWPSTYEVLADRLFLEGSKYNERDIKEEADGNWRVENDE